MDKREHQPQGDVAQSGRRARRTAASPIWSRPEPGTRRPRHSREQIAAAALAIADREGFAAVSMRRVAAELGAGTMTLYHYVRTKADLVDLMEDAIMASVLVAPEALAGSWRERLAAIARSSAAAFAAHPWALEALRGARGGPNGMRHFDQTLATVDGLALTVREKLDLVLTVDDYVFGFVLRSGETHAYLDDQATVETIESYVDAQLASDDYPHVQALFGAATTGESIRLMLEVFNDDARFERGLQRLLDGIERDLERRGALT